MSDVDRSRPEKAQRRRGAAYDWRDHPDNQPWDVQCDSLGCARRARWSIATLENFTLEQGWDSTVKALACGVHLAPLLDSTEWGLDAVMVYDLAMIPEVGC